MAPTDIVNHEDSEYLWTAVEEIADKVVKSIGQRQEPIGLLNKLNQLLSASQKMLARMGQDKEKITKFYSQTIRPVVLSMLEQKGVGNKEVRTWLIVALFASSVWPLRDPDWPVFPLPLGL